MVAILDLFCFRGPFWLVWFIESSKLAWFGLDWIIQSWILGLTGHKESILLSGTWIAWWAKLVQSNWNSLALIIWFTDTTLSVPDKHLMLLPLVYGMCRLVSFRYKNLKYRAYHLSSSVSGPLCWRLCNTDQALKFLFIRSKNGCFWVMFCVVYPFTHIWLSAWWSIIKALSWIRILELDIEIHILSWTFCRSRSRSKSPLASVSVIILLSIHNI
jgi:hypothetical protein